MELEKIKIHKLYLSAKENQTLDLIIENNEISQK